ncbi:MAG TPA: hypothetical protein VLK65_14150 [Vicinamibacteria bacterium]|nr:hypothetical protein [Vicinamibacteria bacterium]
MSSRRGIVGSPRGLISAAIAILCGFSSGSLVASTPTSGPPAQVYKGLEITVSRLERATNVSLQDCPPGGNTVRGVIRPNEENEFATVTIDVKVLPSFEPVRLDKPVLIGKDGETYKTAQSFADFGEEPSYTCTFAFRVAKGANVTRFAIEEATFDLATLTE